jgi:ribosomal RNA-processing protein 8
MVGGGKGQGWVVESDFLTSVPLPGRAGGSGSESVEVKKGKKGRKIGTGTGTGGDASEIVDVVICCLSLMGTNWIGGIYEACRILKPG